MDCPSCDAPMKDVLGGGWYCRACGMLFEIHRSRPPSPLADLMTALLRVTLVVTVGMVAGVLLVSLALAWPAAGGVSAEGLIEAGTLQKAVAVSAVIMLFAASSWAWSGRSRRNLVAAVVLSGVIGAVGGYFVEDGQPLQALEVGAAGAGMGLITWICACGRRRDRT